MCASIISFGSNTIGGSLVASSGSLICPLTLISVANGIYSSTGSSIVTLSASTAVRLNVAYYNGTGLQGSSGSFILCRIA
jgi:hypothetical protein